MLRLTHHVGDKVLLRTEDGRQLDVIVLYAHRGRVELGYAGDRSIEVLREDMVNRRPQESKE